MTRFDARVISDGVAYFDRNVVVLAVRDNDRRAFLMRDGTWQMFADGEVPSEIGIELPSAAIEAIAVAVQEYQGHTSHADTEARVLREWLAVERERVDKALVR